MSTELIINASLPETRVALMEDGEIQELLIERASGKGIVGNIYKGRVTRVLPGMQAAFVDIGLEKAAFLYVDDVYVHSEVIDEQEATVTAADTAEEGPMPGVTTEYSAGQGSAMPESAQASSSIEPPMSAGSEDQDLSVGEIGEPEAHELEAFEEEEAGFDDEEELDVPDDLDDESEDDDGEGEPTRMGPAPGGEGGGEGSGGEGSSGGGDGGSSSSSDAPAGTVSEGGGFAVGSPGSGAPGGAEGEARRRRRGRRGGRNRRGRGGEDSPRGQGGGETVRAESSGASHGPEVIYDDDGAGDDRQSDRAALGPDAIPVAGESVGAVALRQVEGGTNGKKRPEFREPRSRDRKIRSKSSSRPPRGQANIQDLLQEGQEVLVQVAKDPISTKGARLTCHISLPGRHLVCMPTIDHVGVSRRIDRDDERRRLRDFVENNRSKKLGFIVRTASGKGQKSEARIKQDIDYLTRLWEQIRERSAQVSAPALVYEDLNSILRAIRDWVSEEIDRIVVDSRFHFNEIMRFCSHFLPSLRQKVELYHGDLPIFDKYGISSELARALERKVWLKSGGYLVIDQAEALVAIDVNTGRYVGKKSLEETILKTNLEAVQEIAYQLRLRNCGGIIILDLIDMEKEENKHRVYRALEEALKKDRARPSILKISELGLVEMTRKRTRDTMVRALCESCPTCEGKGYQKSKQTVAYEILRDIEREGIARDVAKILIQAHPDVIDTLAIEERDTLDNLERRYKKQVYLQAVGDNHIEQYKLSGEKRDGSPVARDAATEAFEQRERELERSGGRRPDREQDRQASRDRSRDRGGRGGRGGRDRGRGGRGQNNPNPLRADPTQGMDEAPRVVTIPGEGASGDAGASADAAMSGGMNGGAPQGGGNRDGNREGGRGRRRRRRGGRGRHGGDRGDRGPNPGAPGVSGGGGDAGFSGAPSSAGEHGGGGGAGGDGGGGFAPPSSEG